MTPTAAKGELEMIRTELWEPLTRVLDAVVAADPDHAPAKAALVRPVRMLEAMAREAAGALGDDAVAAERLRLLVTFADPATPPATVVPAMLAGAGNLDADSLEAVNVETSFVALAPPLTDVAPCEPALLHLGTLVIVALAAGRVGLALGLSEPMVNNVLGLALAAGPAEVLARQVHGGMEAVQVAAVLDGLTSHGNGKHGLSASLAVFVADACERHRWLCLQALFQQVREDIADNPWNAAGASFVRSVSPQDACPGDEITIELDGGASAPDGLDIKHYGPLLEAGDARVVFASLGRNAEARRPTAVVLEAPEVRVRVPSRGRAGWIGFTDAATVDAVNQARLAVRKAWATRNEQLQSLAHAPVPVEVIPLLEDPPTPPRSPGGSFAGGLPTIVDASLEPGEVDPGGALELRWRVEGGAKVTIEPSPGEVKSSGRETLVANGDSARVERTIVAVDACGHDVRATVRARVRSRIVGAETTQGPDGSALVRHEALNVDVSVVPADARGVVTLGIANWEGKRRIVRGTAKLRIPGNLVDDGLTGTLRAFGPDGGVDHETPFGPIALLPAGRRTVVLVRPAFPGRTLRRVGAAEATKALSEAGARTGVAVQALEPALLGDEDLTWSVQPDSADVPATSAMLELLNVLAAYSPGHEDALWLAVVPGGGNGGFARVESADAAVAVAVCTPDRIADVLARPLGEPAPRTARLRVVGSVDPRGTVRLEGVRVEERAAGGGSPLGAALALHALSGESVQRREPVRLLSARVPARFVALLPVTPDTNALEIHADATALRASALGRGMADAVGAYAAAIGSRLGRSSIAGGARSSLRRRVRRPSGEPELSAIRVEDGRVSWEYAHSGSVRASFTVEIGRGDSWSPVAFVGPCCDVADLPLPLLFGQDGRDRVRVVASDGWNAHASPAFGTRLGDPLARHRVLARSDGRDGLWADVHLHADDLDLDVDDFDPQRIRWDFGGSQSRGYTVRIPDGYSGNVTLLVRVGSLRLRDRRTVVDGRVAPRGSGRPTEAAHA